MIAMNRRNAQWVYTGVQGLYWLTYGLMLSFASVYLQGRGFPNRQIGFLPTSYAVRSLCHHYTSLSILGIDSWIAIHILQPLHGESLHRSDNYKLLSGAIHRNIRYS